MKRKIGFWSEIQRDTEVPVSTPKKSLVQVYFPKRGMNLSYYNDRLDLQMDNLSGMKVTSAIAERGHDYYTENRVVYLCIGRSYGRGIVEGTSPYEIGFDYGGGPT